MVSNGTRSDILWFFSYQTGRLRQVGPRIIGLTGDTQSSNKYTKGSFIEHVQCNSWDSIYCDVVGLVQNRPKWKTKNLTSIQFRLKVEDIFHCVRVIIQELGNIKEDHYLDCLKSRRGSIVSDIIDEPVSVGSRHGSEDLQVQQAGALSVVLEADHLGGCREVHVGVRDVHGIPPSV